MFVYVNRMAYAEHVALVKGDLETEGPVLVRMHALNVLEDVLGDASTGKAHELQQAMRLIADAGGDEEPTAKLPPAATAEPWYVTLEQVEIRQILGPAAGALGHLETH